MRDIFSDPERDLSAKRELILDNGNKYHIQQDPRDQYGYWWVHMDKGQVPEHLQGAYTTYKHAKEAVLTYIASHKRPAVVEEKLKAK